MLAHQVAIITGAGRGIGAATARLFAQHGASVVINDLDASAVSQVAEDIGARGGTALAVPGDVTTDCFPDKLVGRAADAFGKVDHVVNNAGFCWDSMLHKMSDEAFDLVLECHARAPFRLIRAAAAHLRGPAKAEIDGGLPPTSRSVINVTSTTGLHGNVGQANYAVAKAGVIGLTKTVAREWGPLGIRCNAVAFGLISTRLTAPVGAGGSVKVGSYDIPQGLPASSLQDWRNGALLQQLPLRRPGLPEEAAGAMLFLASPLASYVTGHVLEVSGGFGT